MTSALGDSHCTQYTKARNLDDCYNAKVIQITDRSATTRSISTMDPLLPDPTLDLHWADFRGGTVPKTASFILLIRTY